MARHTLKVVKEQPASEPPAFDPIDPDEFIDAVQPLLEKQDSQGLHALLKSRWSCDQIRALIASDHTDAKKVALLAVGLVAEPKCIPDLAKHLRDSDRVINEVAEHAMWLIWFRSGTPQANHELARGAQAIERKDFEHAIMHFDRAIAHCPDFPEPYNQKAIALYLLERYDESIELAKQAVERMPWHFGALAGMGHCYAHLDRPREAVENYEKALAINPHLDCLRQTISHLRETL